MNLVEKLNKDVWWVKRCGIVEDLGYETPSSSVNSFRISETFLKKYGGTYEEARINVRVFDLNNNGDKSVFSVIIKATLEESWGPHPYDYTDGCVTIKKILWDEKLPLYNIAVKSYENSVWCKYIPNIKKLFAASVEKIRNSDPYSGRIIKCAEMLLTLHDAEEVVDIGK